MNKTRNIWRLIASIVQLIVGITAIISSIIVINNAQIVHMLKLKITFILAIYLVIVGIIGIVAWVKAKKGISMVCL